MAQQLFALWRRVFDAAAKRRSKDVDRGIKEFDALYRRASAAEQGEYHRMAAAWMKAPD